MIKCTLHIATGNPILNASNNYRALLSAKEYFNNNQYQQLTYCLVNDWSTRHEFENEKNLLKENRLLQTLSNTNVYK